VLVPVLSKIHPVKCCDFANRQRFPVCFPRFSVIFPEFQRNNTPEGDHRTPRVLSSGSFLEGDRKHRFQTSGKTTLEIHDRCAENAAVGFIPSQKKRVPPPHPARIGAVQTRCRVHRNPGRRRVSLCGWPCA